MSRTYYFEFVKSIAADTDNLFPNLLNKFENELGMRYYKFFKYNLGSANRVVGLIQFNRRVGRSKLERSMVTDTRYLVLFVFLQAVSRPMVIPHLRIRLLCQHHNCCLESDICEWGTFSFGGRGRSIESMMRPYILMLDHFKLSEDIGEGLLLDDGLKICLYADALKRLPYDAI
jgi:hypothetical protein